MLEELFQNIANEDANNNEMNSDITSCEKEIKKMKEKINRLLEMMDDWNANSDISYAMNKVAERVVSITRDNIRAVLEKYQIVDEEEALFLTREISVLLTSLQSKQATIMQSSCFPMQKAEFEPEQPKRKRGRPKGSKKKQTVDQEMQSLEISNLDDESDEVEKEKGKWGRPKGSKNKPKKNKIFLLYSVDNLDNLSELFE